MFTVVAVPGHTLSTPVALSTAASLSFCWTIRIACKVNVINHFAFLFFFQYNISFFNSLINFYATFSSDLISIAIKNCIGSLTFVWFMRKIWNKIQIMGQWNLIWSSLRTWKYNNYLPVVMASVSRGDARRCRRGRDHKLSRRGRHIDHKMILIRH